VIIVNPGGFHRSGRALCIEAMLEDKSALDRAILEFVPDVIVHLAAQAGVRYSIEHPGTYIAANVVGTFNILEAARSSFLVASLCAPSGAQC